MKSNHWAILEGLDQSLIWHPFTQMKDYEGETPLIIEKAEGNYLFDIYGKKYFDGVSSLWVTVHGHCHPAINKAVKKQLGKLDHSTLLGLSHVPVIELSKKLVDIAPRGLTKVFYSDNGSTAVEIALKMAFQYWQNISSLSPISPSPSRGEGLRARVKIPQKTKFLTFENAYHGDTIGSVSVGGIDLFHKTYKPLLFETILANEANAIDLIQKHHKNLAAVVIEPIIQGAAGMLTWKKGFLKKLSQTCRANNVFLICDEVATGFGRTGKMFACEHEGVTPDFLCLSKGITGGYLPLAVTMTTNQVYKGFCAEYKEQKTFFHGHTYTGNPLACSAALANLDIFKKEKTLKKLQPKIAYLSKKLKKISSHPHVLEIRQRGLMVGIELIQDKKKKTPYPWEEKRGVQVILEARKKGIILRPLGNVVVLMPPLSITKSEIDFLIDVVFQAITKVTQ